MRSHQARATALLAFALLLAVTIAACGRNRSTTTAAAPTIAAPTIAAPTSAAMATAAVMSDAPAGLPSVVSPTDTATGGPTAVPTPDPVASQLDQIDQLINDIGNSLNNSDSSQQGGE